MNRADVRTAAIQVVNRESSDAQFVSIVLQTDGINEQKAAFHEVILDAVSAAIQRYVALRERTSSE